MATKTIREKFMESDVLLATARAGEFLSSQSISTIPAPEPGKPALVLLSVVDLTNLLADYDLKMLDDMFNDAGGQNEPETSTPISSVVGC